MAKIKTEKIASIEQEIEQLKNRQKKLLQEQKLQERKDRTKRLCKRAGLLESMLPDTISLTDEQFKSFLEKAVANDYGRRTLAGIAARSGVAATPKTADAAQSKATATAQQTEGNGEAATTGA